MRENFRELRKDDQQSSPAGKQEGTPETIGLADAEVLQRLLVQYVDKRVIVLGPPCIGKTTILRHVPGAQDMDEILFSQLSPEEKAVVFQKPWTPVAGREMRRLACAKIAVSPGQPVFATVVLDADIIIELKISDDLLRQRVLLRQERPQSFEDVKGIQEQLSTDIRESGIPSLELFLPEKNQGH